MNPSIHYNDFYNQLWEQAPLWEKHGFEKLVFIEDIEGKLKFLIWTDSNEIVEKVKQELKKIDNNQVFFQDEVWQSKKKGTSNADKKFYESVWNEAKPISGSQKIRYLSRVRNRGSWFQNVETIWSLKDNPKVIVFYSFKGGVGRTTSLAATALDLSKRGKKVVVIDADLDAPGIGVIFPPDKYDKLGLGIMDYLIETKNSDYPLTDYFHQFKPEQGEPISVFPSAVIHSGYLSKLARLDMEPEKSDYPLKKLLEKIKNSLFPDYILIDGRSGLADSSGILLNGFAHLHVLFGTVSEQSWKGIEYVIERLGKQRIADGKKQANCILVQTMLPQNLESKKLVEARFKSRALNLLNTTYYYSAKETQKGWATSDHKNPDAPHNTVSIRYYEPFGTFQNIQEIESELLKYDHTFLFQRIANILEGKYE